MSAIPAFSRAVPAKPQASSLSGPVLHRSDSHEDAQTDPTSQSSFSEGSTAQEASRNIGLRLPRRTSPLVSKPSLSEYTLIVGGSFNPPHLGHLWMVQDACKRLSPKEVWILPAFVHADKKDLAPFESRMAMCQALFANAATAIQVKDHEQKAPPSGQTADTISFIQRDEPTKKFALLIGSDLATHIHSWDCWPVLREQLPIFTQPRAAMLDSQSALSARPETLEPQTFSSTLVRHRVKNGLGVDMLVGRDVAALIDRDQLYRLAGRSKNL